MNNDFLGKSNLMWSLIARTALVVHGSHGVWGELETCPVGKFVDAFRVKQEARQPDGWDDSATDSIEMTCSDDAETKAGIALNLRFIVLGD